MKKNSITFIFLFCCLISVSQNKSKDSLLLELKKARHDTTLCNIYDRLIEIEVDDNVWPKYNDERKKIAEKNLARQDL